MIFCYKFNFQRIKQKALLSKIEQVEMLIALGRGDKYRLIHIRETLESGRELYISDKNFLQDLVKTHLKDRIYQARVVSVSQKGNLFCEECGAKISADEKFCTSCGAQKPEPSPPSTVDTPEPTPEPEIKPEIISEKQEHEGFTFTDDGDIGEISTRETAQKRPESQPSSIPKPSDILSKFSKKSRQQELEEYEKKYLKESKTNVSWKAYDVKAKRKVEIQNPKVVKMKNGKWAVKGTSPITGIRVFRIVGNEKPNISGEKTGDSQKVEEPIAPAEKPKGSQKTEPEVFSRYYRSPEDESPKPKKAKSKKSKSKKPNLFCEECGSKIAAKDMFCTNCGAKR